MSSDTGPRWRWRVAALLNRSKRTCWAELACWALKWDGYRLPGKQSAACRADLDRCGSCYCGKIGARDARGV